MKENKPGISELGPQQHAGSDPRPKRTRRPPEDDAPVRNFAIDAARLARDLKCEDVLLLDLRELSDVTDYILIASGTSDRQIKSVSDDLQELAQSHGFSRIGVDADGPTTWLVLDFFDVVIHLFEPAARAHYDLEMMWGDAPQVAWRREQ